MALPVIESGSTNKTNASVHSVLTEVSTALSDTGNLRWTKTELTKHLVDGLHEIRARVPETAMITIRTRLEPGPLQFVPSGGRFVAVDGDYTNGRSPTEVTKAFLDGNTPDWMTAYDSYGVRAYAKHPTNPRAFYVYPPVPATGSGTGLWECYLTYIDSGAAITGITDTSDFYLPGRYLPALVSYILSRAFAKDDEAGSQALAQSHYQAFLNLLSSEKTYA